MEAEFWLVPISKSALVTTTVYECQKKDYMHGFKPEI